MSKKRGRSSTIGWCIAVGLSVFLWLFQNTTGWATEEYAETTRQSCAVCHLEPSGGGDLTAVGAGYAAGGYRWPVPSDAPARALSTGSKLLRLVLGYAHLLAAFAWFGTIFYVHVVLKPAYAKGGLPRTEMRLAWAAILVMALSGVPLLLFKYPSLGALLTTRSGKLLTVKIGLYLFLVVSAAGVSLFLSPKLKKRRSTWQDHDGREGRPAWVKVGDTLHDLTASPRWAEGTHFRRHQAGEDLTAALKSAPHGPEKLEGFPSFSLTEKSLQKESAEVRLLYLMAYVNLFVALGVLLVIAWMRWGP